MKLDMEHSGGSHIVWALDALAEDGEPNIKMAAALRAWSAGGPALIEPTYVLGAEILKVPPRHFAEHQATLLGNMRARLQVKVQKLELPGAIPPKILIADPASTRQACAALVNHATATGADLIAVTSHSRAGPVRWVLGSFAETLMQMTTVPVLITTPRTRPIKSIQQVLVPTDLSQSARQSFSRVIALAARFGAKLTLLHVAQFAAEHGEAAFGPAESYFAHQRDDLAERDEALHKLARSAMSCGVSTTVLPISEGASPEVAIVRAANKIDGGIVAMISHKVAMEAAVLGSVSRRVVRRSPLPIWVLHAE